MVSAPSSSTSCSGQAQVCSLMPSLDGQPGLCPVRSPHIGWHSNAPTVPPGHGNTMCSCSIRAPHSSILSSCSYAVMPSHGGMSWPCPAVLSVGVHCGSTSGAPSAVSPCHSSALSMCSCSVGAHCGGALSLSLCPSKVTASISKKKLILFLLIPFLPPK